MNAAGSDDAVVLSAEETKSRMESEIGSDDAWKSFNLAVTGFCYNQSLALLESDKLISTLVGEELEWFGSHGLLFMVNKLIENELDKRTLEIRYAAQEASLENEISINRSLRSQLTRTQRAAQDKEWRLQEQLAQTDALLRSEKALSLELQSQVSQLSTQMEHMSEIHSENNSHYGENSAVTSPSTMTTPPATWRDASRRSTGSSWGGGDGRLQRVAEKLNITPNQAIIAEDDL